MLCCLVRLAAFADLGRAADAVPIIQAVGPENVLVVQIRATYRPVIFPGDIRGWVDPADLPEGVMVATVGNAVKDNPHVLGQALVKEVHRWIDAREQARTRARLYGAKLPDHTADDLALVRDLEE